MCRLLLLAATIHAFRIQLFSEELQGAIGHVESADDWLVYSFYGKGVVKEQRPWIGTEVKINIKPSALR